jgi:hypothetical protein
MIRQFRALAVAGLTAGSLLTVGASAAFAGTPTPEPTITSNFGVPNPQHVRSCDRQVREVRPHAAPTGIGLTAKITNPTPTPVRTIEPRVRCRPEHFNLAEVLAGPNLGTVITDYVAATGPVSGVGSDDLAASTNTFDRFILPGGNVNVQHTGITFPAVNLGTCTAVAVQVGLWRFNGGSGINRFAVGNGIFRLALLAHFPSIRGTCVLQFLRGNPLLQHRVSPDFLTVAVHGDGVAAR